MRKIQEIIVHCTATRAGRSVTACEIDIWHKARGWKGIGYHYVVMLDGVVVAGRSENEVGAHCNGKNATSIGVVYVGGLEHRRCGLLLSGEVQVGIDICGGGEGTVAQPDLDLFHGDAVAQQEAGTGVTKVMEADLPQTVLTDHPSKVLRHEVGPQELAHLIHADVVQVVPAVGAFEQLPVLGLLLLLRQ